MVAIYSDSGESRTSKEVAYTVSDTEGEVDFGDILAKPESDAQSLPTAAEESAAEQQSQPQAAAAPDKEPGQEIIICFGDSLTSGTGASAGMDYPSQLARMLGKPVINKGIPGDTTTSALRRLDRDVLSQNPDIVLITLGGNDLKNGVSKNIAFRNLEYIVKTIQGRGAKVIIGGLKFPGRDRGYGREYNELAKESGATLIPDIFAGIVDNLDLMSDPIHPNDAGYRIIAQRFHKALATGQKTTQTAGIKAALPAAKTAAPNVQKKVPVTQDVTVAWDDVPNATSYNIYWSDKSGVNQKNGTKIANVTNPYKLKNLIEGKKYYFIVTAVNQSGESPPSEEFSFTVGK
jgi:lysophospholipase L1-like esterase